MAMTSLNISFDATRQTGQMVQTKAADFKDLLVKIQKANDSLKNCWKGADAESYTAKISEQAVIMNKLQITIDEIGKYLIQTANLYQKTMEENTLK